MFPEPIPGWGPPGIAGHRQTGFLVYPDSTQNFPASLL